MSRLLDSKTVAEKITFSESTVLNWAYGRKPAPAGFPPPKKISNRLLWVEDDLDAWIDSMSIYKTHTTHQTASDLPVKRGRGRPRKGY